MTVYLGDLTHDTITISNEAFPLNVGYIAAYLTKTYPEAQVEIFKYPFDLKEKIDSNVPDILALSNYPWNTHLSMEFLRYVKSIRPQTLTVMGGPNISYEPKYQLKFLEKFESVLDYYVMFEGEEPFKLLYKRALETNYDVEEMRKKVLPGVIYVKKGKLSELDPVERQKNLEEIPSPYLEGWLDKFFDGKLTPMIETHRGCPYKCTFCHEGNQFYSKINKHKEKRTISELKYICSHVGTQVTDLIIADPNFGLFKTHINIAEKLAELKDQYGYPKTIIASSAKNSQKNLIEISRKLKQISMPIWMSVQSLTDKVLENIKRNNISTDQMLEVQSELKKYNIPTKSEVIMCLPGETLESHIASIVELIRLRMDLISTYQLMLVNGSEMKDNDDLKGKYGFVTRYRVLPRNFTELVGKKAIEVEEIVVATNDFPYSDYIKGRILHLIISIFYNGKVFSGFFRLAFEIKVDIKLLVENLIKEVSRNHALSGFVDAFLGETEGELFDSEESLREYFFKEENFAPLVSGEVGGNLLQKYTAMAYLEHSDALVEVMHNVMTPIGKDAIYSKKLKDVTEYYRLSFSNFLAGNRLEIVDQGVFNYDIQSWLESDSELDSFRFFEGERTVEFRTSKNQYQAVIKYFQRYGETAQAFGKIMTRLWIGEMLRIPTISPKSEKQLLEKKRIQPVPESMTLAVGGSHVGAGRMIQKNRSFVSLESYMKNHMDKNRCFLHGRGLSIVNNERLLLNLRDKYEKYRQDWNRQPRSCISKATSSQVMRTQKVLPLCVDIETSALCDLACPFCFRGNYATPDKLIDSNLCYELLDQVAELGIPSVKFNWRGEPLLHPKLPDFIDYAKRKGILETIVNTNATNLTEKKARELITSGLDYMIYSFDGGSKETYERMRPGRFRENSFEIVYANIQKFKSIRDSMDSPFPFTKVQMILTKETFKEKERFFNLFSDCVDDVSASQYSERGGRLLDIDEKSHTIYKQALIRHGLPGGTPYMKDLNGNLFVSKGRKPCEQPFQRLLITYEGRVAMCCYDWGATHPVGYVDSGAFNNIGEYEKIVRHAKNKAKGFELLSNMKMPRIMNTPTEKVQTLADIWYGKEIEKVREKHIVHNVDEVNICRNCTFKDTYEWISADESASSNLNNERAAPNFPEDLL